jgi:hypothetical protein
MVDACAINLALFAPWGVYLGPRQRELLGRPGPTLAGDQRIIEQADVTRKDQGHPALPAAVAESSDIGPIYDYDRHGQGELFSVPTRKAT